MSVGWSIEPASKLDEEILVRRAQERDLEAFEALYLRYFETVCKWIRRRLWRSYTTEDVRDVGQEVFTVAWKQLPGVRPGAFKAFLYGVTRNMICEANKRIAKERGLFSRLPDTAEEVDRLVEKLEASHIVDPTHKLQKAELRKVVQEAIGLLSETQRSVILLSDFDGLSYKDIAAILLTSEPTVKSRLHDARQRLKTLLKGYVEPRPQGTTTRQVTKTTKVESCIEFEGENVSLEQYKQMPLEEKFQLQERVEQENLGWLQRSFSSLPGVTWIMVVDGEVIAHGGPNDFPSDERLLEFIYSKARGKYPFCFGSPFETAIEEGSSSWQPTVANQDYYPTLLVRVGTPQVEPTVEVIADFDTGAPVVYCDLEWLEHKGISRHLGTEPVGFGRHLGEIYRFIRKLLRFTLVDESGTSGSIETATICVFEWKHGPFVKINPNRVALLGRNIPLELKPIIHLDFDQRESRVHFKRV